MKKMLTIDEFIEVLTKTLRSTLEKDYGDTPSHVVDLVCHTAAQFDAISNFIYEYSGLKDAE